MKKIGIIFLILLFCGCAKNQKVENDYQKLMQENEHLIIDVRTKEEYENQHIKDAINIPLNELEQITIAKNVMLFVYCKSGARSQEAYEILKEMGYSVHDLGAIASINLPKE